MPIPNYLQTRYVTEYKIDSEYDILDLPQTSFYVNTEDMQPRSFDAPFESRAMADCVFPIDENGNLIL